MRLIGSLDSSEEAVVFQKYVKSQGIDLFTEILPSTKKVQIWVIHEEDTEKASLLLEDFAQNPSLPEYYVADELKEPSFDSEYEVEQQDEKMLKRFKWPYFTWIFIAFTTLCFLIQMVQTASIVQTNGPLAAEYGMAPITKSFFFDVPSGFEQLEVFLQTHDIKTPQQLDNMSPELKKEWIKLNEASFFHGFLDMLEDPGYKDYFFKNRPELFAKIKQGQIYRLITPVFLHGSILHLIFNMIWLFILLKQVEIKLGLVKTCVLLVGLSIVPNIAQYLVSGPFFLGASGIVVGLAGFIWARQKKAPWEGYVLSRAVIFFLMVYVLALVVLSLGVFVFNILSVKDLSFGIANTAHLIGGLTGIALGRLAFFKRL
jgi:GlpG protein